jgi:multiple sugar transport system substrate-binding protein
LRYLSNIIRLALCVIAPLGMNGCIHTAAEPAGAIHLSVWCMWSGQEEKNFIRVLDRYHELHPEITIETLGAIRDDTKSVRARVAGVPPDLFTLYNPLFVGPLSANGALQPLDGLFKSSGFKEQDFVKASLDLCRYRGRLYGMPFLIDDQALLYNKKAFKAAGLNPERPPATLEELERDAIKLTKTDENDRILQLGIAPVYNRSFEAGDLPLLFLLFGGGLLDASGTKPTPDRPENIKALIWYKGLIDKMGGGQKVNAFAAGFGQPQGANNPFFMGKIAMMINGEWNPYWKTKYAPNLDFGVAPFPAPASRPDRQRSIWFGGNVFCIPKGSKHAKEAWELLAWFQTDEAQILFAGAMNNVPNRKSSLHSPVLRTGAPYKAQYSKFLDLAETPNGANFPTIPAANLYYTQMYDMLDTVLAGQKTPEQALRDVRVKVQKELDKYK